VGDSLSCLEEREGQRRKSREEGREGGREEGIKGRTRW